MTKEEILEKSRKENRGKDIADIESAKSGIWGGWTVVISLSIFFALYDLFTGARIPFEMFSAILAGLSVVFFVKFSLLKKVHELLVAIFYSVLTVVFFILWIIL